jgi:hypothetical protein
MQTQTLVQASADVISITHLSKGDVYKRLEKEFNNNYKMMFGVVMDVMHNGEDAAISALEFQDSYPEVKAEQKTFGTDSDLKIFSTNPEEVQAHVDDLKDSARRNVKERREQLERSETTLSNLTDVFDNVVRQGITAPSVRTPALDTHAW